MNTIDLQPGVVNLQMESSDYRAIEFSFTVDAAPMDLTGWTVTIEGPEWMTVEPIDAANGAFRVQLRPDVKAAQGYRIKAVLVDDSRILLTGNVTVL